MAKTAKKRKQLETLVLGGILTALVVVLQYVASIIKIGGVVSVSLVLIPIVIGAATCSVKISTWLGLVFSIVVLFQPDTQTFFAISVHGTIITVLAKGIACGLVAGVIYKLFEKKSIYLATYLSAIVTPIVNTGIFLIGGCVFFLDAIREWAIGSEFNNVAAYMIFGLAGFNFLFEFVTSILLAPIIIRILNIRKKNK